MIENLKKIYLNNVQVVHGQKMINLTEGDIPFVDQSGDFEEILKAPDNDLLFSTIFASAFVQEFLEEFKSEHQDIILVGNASYRNAFGEAVSVPISHRNRKDEAFLYYKFK